MESKLCRWMPVFRPVFFLLFCGHIRYTWTTEAVLLRGVAPSMLSHYQNRSNFTCLSGRNEIDNIRVNDDVCDCADGSDEPGTSACANGIFHCRNQGFKSRDLPTTFVDDGICDCCDGSDETQGCKDSCQALGELARLDAQTKLDRFLAGANARSTLLTEAARKLHAWKERSKQLEETVGQLKPVVHQLNEEMQEAQKQQREAEEAEKASVSSSQDHAGDPSEEEHGNAVPDHVDDDSDEYEDVQEDGRDDPSDVDAEARRIAAQWTSDLTAAGNVASQEEAPCTHGDDEVEAGAEEDASGAGENKSVLQKLADTVRSLGKAVWSPRKDTAKSAQEQLIQLTRASKQAVQKHTAKKHELRAAEIELKTLKDNLARDYGPKNVYAALQDVCLEIPQDKYRYRVCGFGKAAQVEGASEVSLGKFDRCEDGCSNMFYTQGQACWQGPARSIHVKLQCGPRNEIVSIEEPERCVYIAVATSPAQCNDSVVQRLRTELSQFSFKPETDIKDEL